MRGHIVAFERRDATHPPKGRMKPWVKTHGYHRCVATRRGTRHNGLRSIPKIAFVIMDFVFNQERPIFLLEGLDSMMLALVTDVGIDFGNL